MVARKRHTALLLAVVLIAAGVSSEVRAAATIAFGEDGWYTWSIPAVNELPEARFYVRVKSGKPQEIELVGHWCNGWKHTRTRHPDATDFGLVNADESIDWFRQYIGDRSDLSSDALAAISMHPGNRAVRILIDVVESDAHMDVREEAVFWMAQSGSEAAFAYLDRLLMKQ